MQLKRYLVAFIVLLGAAATACGSAGERAGEPDKSGKLPMDHIAEQYVRLILAVGQHDPDYVDAYYGPPEWKPSGDKVGLDLLAREAASLTEQLRQGDAGRRRDRTASPPVSEGDAFLGERPPAHAPGRPPLL